METIIKYILLFFFYSAAGWCLESLYCSIGEKRFVNRGFLTGPLCPIYGTAALVLVILIYNPFKDNPLAVFVLGIILCDIVEYITSYIMEKLFSARWWDYTYEFMNIGGRICLKHTLYWGVISIIFVKTIHPAVDNLYSRIDGPYLKMILFAVLGIFTLDLINAVRKALDIRKLQIKINNLTNSLSEELSIIKSSFENKYSLIQNVVIKQTDKLTQLKYQLDDLTSDVEKFLLFEKKPKDKEKSLSNRLFYNNPTFERLTENRLIRLKNIIDDIKSNISESEEKQ
ncbi:MAG: putative ABC transporter permease [Clostridia bacterium]|nr:putative ABC transporter permease [Clostridia bacterium]